MVARVVYPGVGVEGIAERCDSVMFNMGNPREMGLREFILTVCSTGKPPPRGDWQPTGDPVVAEIVAGRWVVRCPDCEGGQETACLHDPIFYCLACFNLSNMGRVREVIFPAPADRDAIEVVLMAREDTATRSWLIGETLEGLQAENIEHGEPLTPGGKPVQERV